MTGIPAVLMRGGTSKGVFLHAGDVPPPGPGLDGLVLDLLGSPDPLQIDGLGGTYSSTSKVMIVDVDDGGTVHYRFGQVGIDTATVDWSGNCGNLTTAVAAFAVDEGLVQVTAPVTRIPMLNVNTGVRIEAEVPIAHGRAAVHGEQRVPGVPRPGAPITTHYRAPAGAATGTLFPTGARSEHLDASGGRPEATIVDVTSAFVVVRAHDLGLKPGTATTAELEADRDLMERVEQVRGAAAYRMGVVADPTVAVSESPVIPRIVMLAPPWDDQAHVEVVAVSMGAIHRALPMTAALCLGAVCRIPGTVAHAVAAEVGSGPLRLRHPLGVVEVVVETRTGDDLDAAGLQSVGIVRTARRLMCGTAYPYDDRWV